jgi:hypothetical protein
MKKTIKQWVTFKDTFKPRAEFNGFYEKMAQKRNEILNGPLLDCFNLIQSLHDDLVPPASK